MRVEIQPPFVGPFAISAKRILGKTVMIAGTKLCVSGKGRQPATNLSRKPLTQMLDRIMALNQLTEILYTASAV